MARVISEREWYAYFQKLSQIESKAASEMLKAINARYFATTEELSAYCYALVSKSGGAASSLACEMYDEIAAAQGAAVASAVPAPTLTTQEIDSILNATKTTRELYFGAASAVHLPPETGRMVKQASADTMIQNAARDGAEFAFIPNGDTCAFCRVLGSKGWRTAYNVPAGTHAAHIHPHCDCTYCVRFTSSGGVAGYDPAKYLREYNSAEGYSAADRLRAMARSDYEANRTKILAQKREAYAARKEREEKNDN